MFYFKIFYCIHDITRSLVSHGLSSCLWIIPPAAVVEHLQIANRRPIRSWSSGDILARGHVRLGDRGYTCHDIGKWLFAKSWTQNLILTSEWHWCKVFILAISQILFNCDCLENINTDQLYLITWNKQLPSFDTSIIFKLRCLASFNISISYCFGWPSDWSERISPSANACSMKSGRNNSLF